MLPPRSPRSPRWPSPSCPCRSSPAGSGAHCSGHARSDPEGERHADQFSSRNDQVARPLLDVRPEYLNSGCDEVKATYGAFDRYLKDGLGIDARELKELKRDLLVG
ncbi:tyrosine-protein phosphatase [Streptomyces sp. MJM1172]|uniref:tyrosine-protein phosphatase n=1 Tax=Streptomyces sp. MJM1172 TaxID=1703926 RepID=UPI0023780A32|nr:tyrosine-protein phosphatase [Streptomyces sp. MJM1172]